MGHNHEVLPSEHFPWTRPISIWVQLPSCLASFRGSMSHLLSAQGLLFHLAPKGDTYGRTEPQCCEGQKKQIPQPPWRRGVSTWSQTSDKSSVHDCVDCLWPLVKASGKKERGREGEKPSLGQGPRVIVAFHFSPKVLCDLGENHCSLNRPGTEWGDGREMGSLLANSSHVCVARNNEVGSMKPVLSLRGKQYKLFILGAWLHQFFQLSSETPWPSWHSLSEAAKSN